MKKLYIVLCSLNYLYASAPHAVQPMPPPAPKPAPHQIPAPPPPPPAPTATITANKQAAAVGRDLLTTNNIQNNTEVATETQVLTAVVSIVAINGGSYGDVNIVQTAGSQTENIGNVGGDVSNQPNPATSDTSVQEAPSESSPTGGDMGGNVDSEQEIDT